MTAALLVAIAGAWALAGLRRRVVRRDAQRAAALAAHHRRIAATRPTVRIIEGDRP